MGIKLGIDGVTKYMVGGVGGGGSWVELTGAVKVSLNMAMGEADSTTRAAGGVKTAVPTLLEIPVEIEMFWDTADAGFQALKSAFLNRSAIGLQIMDEDSGEGWQGDFAVFGFPREEPVDGIQAVTISLKPTYSATAPEYIEGGTGTGA